LVGGAKRRVAVPAGLVVLMWLVEGANLVTRNALDVYGIRPRTEIGLWGILFAPFLHASIAHLLANTVPFLVLGSPIAFQRHPGGTVAGAHRVLESAITQFSALTDTLEQAAKTRALLLSNEGTQEGAPR